MTTVDEALTDLAREHSGRVLAILARRFEDLDLADDAVQNALTVAARRWPEDGIPDNPPAWLMTVARNKAIDQLRREAAADRRRRRAIRDLADVSPRSTDEATEWTMQDPTTIPLDEGDVADERLRLMLLCCHPALGRDAQAALTLRLVAGLTTDEIAAAYLIPVATVAQRITRGKRKIRQARIPMTIPTQIDERLDSVLQVLYLTFNEGYLTRGGHRHASRVDLCGEAIRLIAVVTALAPQSAEAIGLAALLQYLHARRDARFGPDGALITLEDQDRTRWHRDEIEVGNSLLALAMKRMTPGRYQLQAVIASHHVNPRSPEDVDWSRIVSLYDQLLLHDASPVVQLNRASAMAMAQGPEAALVAVDAIDGLDGYHLWHAVRSELLAQTGRSTEAAEGFARARALTDNPAEQRHLDQRIANVHDVGD